MSTARDAPYWREYYAANRERLREYHRERSRRLRAENPGMVAEYARKRRERDATRPRPEACELCARPGKVVWDHCHKGGHFRGWLCYQCNTALGLVGDDTALLSRMVEYLNGDWKP